MLDVTQMVKHPKVRGWLDYPALFSGIRFLLIGSQRETRRRLGQMLRKQQPARVLDVCCGVGDFAGLVEADYIGIDLNERFINLARRRFAAISRKQFQVEDATRMRYSEGAFDTTLYLNCMHHFPEELVRGMLREIARVTKHQVLILDLEPTRGHWLQRFVMACDRGDYVRPIAQQRQLLEEFLEIDDAVVYPMGLTVQTLFTCRPKRTNSANGHSRRAEAVSTGA